MKLLVAALLPAVLFTLSGVVSAQITVVFPAWNSDPVIATQNVQTAINSGADVVILSDPPGTNDWVIRTVDLASSQELQLAAGIVVRNDPNWTGQTAGSDIFHASGVTDVVIRGNAADPARIEFTTTGSIGTAYQGHCVELVGCTEVLVENLIVTSEFGDGIILNEGSGMVPCQDVTIRNCGATGCARNGIAITNAQDVLVEDCELIGSGAGTPASPIVGWGMDLEPDHEYGYLSGITIRNCFATGNKEDAFRVWLTKLKPTSPQVDVLFEDCRVEWNYGAAYQVNCSVTNPPSGTVTFEDCTAEEVDGPGAIAILSYFLIPHSMKVVYDHCRWTNVAKDVRVWPTPIYLATTDGSYSSAASGVDFLACVLDDVLGREPIAVNLGPDEYTPGEFHADVAGRLTVNNSSVQEMIPTLLPNLLIQYLP